MTDTTATQHFEQAITNELAADFELANGEHGSFTLAVDCRGVYGVDTRWIEVSLKAGGPQVIENTTMGGDPAPGTYKALYVPRGSLAVVTAPPVAPQPAPAPAAPQVPPAPAATTPVSPPPVPPVVVPAAVKRLFSDDAPVNTIKPFRPLTPASTLLPSPEVPFAYASLVVSAKGSTGIFRAKDSDSIVVVQTAFGPVSVHMPANVKPAPGGDGHACILDIDGKLWNFYQLRLDGDAWKSDVAWWCDANGTGVPVDASKLCGCTAAGVSAAWGLITAEDDADPDMTKPHPHALRISLGTYQMARGPVAPAAVEDDSRSVYTGTIPMGSFWMIDPAADLSGISDPKIRRIGLTCQTYGAFVTDSNRGTPVIFYAEQGTGFDRDYHALADMEILRKSLVRCEWPIVTTKPLEPTASVSLEVKTGVATGGPVTASDGAVFSFGEASGAWAGDYRILRNGVPVADSGYRAWTGWASVLARVGDAIYSFNPSHDSVWRKFDGTSFVDITPQADPRVPLLSATNLRTGQVYDTITKAVAAANPGDTISVAPGDRNESIEIKKSITIQPSDPTKGWSLVGENFGGGDKGMLYVDNYAHPGPDPMQVTVIGGSMVCGRDIVNRTINDLRAGVWPEGADTTGFGINLTLKNCRIAEHLDGLLGGQHLGIKSTITFDGVHVEQCGGTDLTHNIYCPTVRKFTMTGSRSDNVAGVGHAVKSRARETLLENVLALAFDSQMSCAADFPHGGKVTVSGGVFTHGPNSDQHFNSIRYGAEAPARFEYDDASGYVDTLDFQGALCIQFLNNPYSNPFISIDFDAKMAAAGRPERVGQVTIKGNTFVGWQMEKMQALYPDNTYLIGDPDQFVELYTAADGLRSYRLKRAVTSVPVKPVADPILTVPPIEVPTATSPAADPPASTGPMIIVPKTEDVVVPGYLKGQDLWEWRKAGTDSLSALEQRSLDLGERGLSDATHYLFGIYGEGTITTDDRIVAGQRGGHNGGNNNGGYGIDLKSESPMFDYIAMASLRADRIMNNPSGFNRDGAGASHHPYYAPQYDRFRDVLVQIGLAVVWSDPAIGSSAVTGISLAFKKHLPAGSYPDVPFLLNDMPTATDPRTGDVWIIGNQASARLRMEDLKWDVIPHQVTSWDSAVGVLCVDARRDRLVTIAGPERIQNFCYRDLSDPSKMVPLTLTGPAAWAFGQSKLAAEPVYHPTDRTQDFILVKGPYLPGGDVVKLSRLDEPTWYAESIKTTGGDDLCQDPGMMLYGMHLLPAFERTRMATIGNYYTSPSVLRVR